MKVQSLIFVYFCVVFVFFGCGGADDDQELTHIAPSVSIEKVGEKKTENFFEIEYRIVSDSKPKADLIVMVVSNESYCREYDDYAPIIMDERYDDYFLITIPKGEKQSQNAIIETFGNQSLFVEVLPITTVDIVGEGLVVDQERLQDAVGGHRTVEGRKIPKDYIFPYYEVVDPEPQLFYAPKPAKIISIDTPNGSVVRGGEDMIIVFDNPPQCARTVDPEDHTVSVPFLAGSAGGTRALLIMPFVRRGEVAIVKFKVITGSKELGNEVVSEEFHYTVIN